MCSLNQTAIGISNSSAYATFHGRTSASLSPLKATKPTLKDPLNKIHVFHNFSPRAPVIASVKFFIKTTLTAVYINTQRRTPSIFLYKNLAALLLYHLFSIICINHGLLFAWFSFFFSLVTCLWKVEFRRRFFCSNFHHQLNAAEYGKG